MATCFKQENDCIFRFFPKECNNEKCHATPEMIAAFRQNGFIIVKDLFNEVEVEKLVSAIRNSEHFWNATYGLSDLNKKKFRMNIWSEVGDDVLGKAARTFKVAGICEELLGKGEIYLYHGKTIMKEPKTGGGLVWHQDYGYWYENGIPFPDLITCGVSLTKSGPENGGLEVLKGSHLCGRIEHGKQAGQTGADLERVEMLKEVMELHVCDMLAGDVMFLHSNTLHRSRENSSDIDRWNLLFAYNTKHNTPEENLAKPVYNTPYEMMEKLSISAVQDCQDEKLANRYYGNPNEDKLVSVDA